MTRALMLLLAVIVVIAVLPSQAGGHEVRPGYLQITETEPDEFDILWKVPQQAGKRLRIEPALPSTLKPVTPVMQQLTGEALLQRWTARSDGPLAGETIRIDGLEQTMTDALIRIQWLDGSVIVTRLTPTSTAYSIPTSPALGEVAWTYFVLGVEHILFGIDHLLFVLALLLIVDGSWKLIKTVTAFTIAHSITLALATLGLVHVPGPPVEAIIALSIVFVASEILKKQRGVAGLTERQPWIVAFSFGLLHGFGFAGALSEVGLPSGDIPMALLTFNVGVEVGQLIFVFAFLGVWRLVRFLPATWPSWTAKALPYTIGSVAAFWVIQRVAGF